MNLERLLSREALGVIARALIQAHSGNHFSSSGDGQEAGSAGRSDHQLQQGLRLAEAAGRPQVEGGPSRQHGKLARFFETNQPARATFSVLEASL